jgi:hypothetical protein
MVVLYLWQAIPSEGEHTRVKTLRRLMRWLVKLLAKVLGLDLDPNSENS